MRAPRRDSLLGRLYRGYGLADARAYGRDVWIVSFGRFVSAIGRGIAVPFIAIYLHGVVGIPLPVIGLGLLLEQILRAACAPIAGAISDRVGRKRVMIAGMVATGIAVPGYALVQGTLSYLAVAAFIGAAQAIYFPASQALVADVVPSSKRPGAYALVHMMLNLGWAVGIPLGGLLLLVAQGHYELLFYVAGIAPLVYAGIIAAFVTEPPREASETEARRVATPFADLGRLLAGPVFAATLLLSTTAYLVFGMFNTIIPIFVKEGAGLSDQAVAGIFLINPVLVFFLQLPFGALANTASRTRSLQVAGVFSAAGYAIFAWTILSGWPIASMAFAVALLSVAEVVLIPVASALISDVAPANKRGSALGVLNLAFAVGQAAPPLVAALVLPTLGWSWLWTLFAAYTVLLSWGYFPLRARLAPGVDKPVPVAPEQAAPPKAVAP